MATGGAHDRPSAWVLGLDATPTEIVAACRHGGRPGVVLQTVANDSRSDASVPGASAERLGVLYRHAVGRIGSPPTDVRIACPATWSPGRRQHLLDMAEAAGLPLPVIVLAPVAAALAYAEQHTVIEGAYVLVCQVDYERLEGTVVQARRSGYEPIGHPCAGPIGVGTADHDGQVACTIARLGEMEDVEGLTPDWISAVFLAGDRARTPLVRRLLAESHPGVPIHDRDDSASMISIGATHPLAAPLRRRPMADSSNEAVLVPVPLPVPMPMPMPMPIGDALAALNRDWDFNARQDAHHHRALARRRLAMAGAAAVALVGAVGVLSDVAAPNGRSAWSPVAAAVSTAPPVSVTEPRPAVLAKILPDGYPTARQPTTMVAFDAVLTHLDVKQEWDQNIAGPNTDLGHVCGRAAPNLAVISVRKRFISSTGEEKLSSVVHAFANSVTAQASLMEIERNFAACGHYERSDNGRSVRMEVMPMPWPTDRPRHGDASFAVAVWTARETEAPSWVTQYGLVRHDRYVTEVEFSAAVADHDTGRPPSVSDAQRRQFERLLRRASDRLEQFAD